jgi:hypothetical protein
MYPLALIFTDDIKKSSPRDGTSDVVRSRSVLQGNYIVDHVDVPELAGSIASQFAESLFIAAAKEQGELNVRFARKGALALHTENVVNVPCQCMIRLGRLKGDITTTSASLVSWRDCWTSVGSSSRRNRSRPERR